MRSAGLLLLLILPLLSQSSDESDTVAVVQKTFDGMAAHDAAMIRSTLLPEARLHVIRADGTPGASRSGEEFAAQISTAKGDLIERFTAKPQVLIRGRMAQVWGEYEFLRDGKFTHCGVDSATLFKTPEGWKIAALAYTIETTGCRGR